MITKQEFEDAYEKFPPSKFEIYLIKHASLYNLRNNKLIILIISLFLILPFLIELIYHLFSISHNELSIPNLIYIILLAILGINMSILLYKRHKRYNKIRKELQLTKKDYEKVVDMYYHNNYLNTADYVKNNAKKINK